MSAERRPVLGGLYPPKRESWAEHRIANLRHRRIDPHLNYVECICGWRHEGSLASELYDIHRRAMGRTR